MPRKCAPIAERFWSKVDKRGPDECWPWLGGANTPGYGKFTMAGRGSVQKNAHRVAYELTHGPIPKGSHFVCHRCDVRLCVNPAHLWLGTHADNMQDMDEKGRRRNGSAFGPKNGNVKLTADKVRKIRAGFAAGSNMSQLADSFGVHKATVRFIIRGRTWTHIL